jgi:hypothetical protein
VQGALAIPDQRPGKPAQPPQALGDAPEQIVGLLGEHQGAGATARVAQAANHHPAAATLAVADRDRRRRLPEVELADLARAVEGALEGPGRRREQRTDLTQVLIEDRPAAREALLDDQLADTRGRQARIQAQQPVDLLLMGLELGWPRRTAVARRVVAS